jgi:tetratricopeptide (TPR) repeat protein
MSPSTSFRKLIFAGFICACLLLSSAIAASAQAVGSTRGLPSGEGSNSIQGRVLFPGGQQKMVRINLETTGGIGGMSTSTDPDGAFRFNGLSPGNYTVIIDGGKDFETMREPVNIDISSRGRAVQVNVQLRPKIDAANPAFAGVPRAALDLYQKGSAAAQKGNSKNAVEFLTQAVAAYPNFSQALSDLGAQYLKMFEWAKAADTFESLLKLAPQDAQAHLDLGIALYNLGGVLLADKKTEEANQKSTQAEAHLREAIKLKSPGPSAHYYLGMTLVKLHRYPDAQAELEAAVANGGENIAMAHRMLGGLYQSSHKNKEAADELEKYLKLEPKAKDADKIKEIIAGLRKGQ